MQKQINFKPETAAKYGAALRRFKEMNNANLRTDYIYQTIAAEFFTTRRGAVRMVRIGKMLENA